MLEQPRDQFGLAVGPRPDIVPGVPVLGVDGLGAFGLQSVIRISGVRHGIDVVLIPMKDPEWNASHARGSFHIGNPADRHGGGKQIGPAAHDIERAFAAQRQAGDVNTGGVDPVPRNQSLD